MPSGPRRFRWRPARFRASRGSVSRFIADGVDLVVALLMIGVAYLAVAGAAFLIDPRMFRWPARLGWSILLVGFVIVTPYLMVCWASVGHTHGDALLGLRIATTRGAQLSWVWALLRAILCVVFPLGPFWVAVSASKRSIQDVLLRTSVIYDWSPRAHSLGIESPERT